MLRNYRSLSEFGFPEPENVKSELEMERLKYDPAHQEDLLKLLNQRAPNNLEQMEVFNFVKNAIDKTEHDRELPTYIFINGPAGSGKSTLSQKSKYFTLLLI
jgi:polynucleotide 5'-kinase involved in rRNA processing